MMDVSFKIRRADIKKFISLAEREKAPEGHEWVVFLRITDCVGHFQAGRTSIDFPVDGLSKGLARFPLSVLWRVMDGRKAVEVEYGFSDGVVVCGKQTERSEQIKIGMVLDNHSDAVVYPTQLELLVIGRTLSKEAASELGIEKLLEGAKSRMMGRVSEAIGLLGQYGVAPNRVEELVEQAINSAEAQIRAKFYLR
jgi:hypothetical protein